MNISIYKCKLSKEDFLAFMRDRKYFNMEAESLYLADESELMEGLKGWFGTDDLDEIDEEDIIDALEQNSLYKLSTLKRQYDTAVEYWEDLGVMVLVLVD